MLHHQFLKAPVQDYPPNEWDFIERSFHPEFVSQTEAVMALGNGYIGMRGAPEEATPSVHNATFVNGFYEKEGLSGQAMLSVPDTKIIRLIVDDEVFQIDTSNILEYDRRLNMKSGTLDRELVWETLSGARVAIRSRRLVSFQQRHVAVISYEMTLLNVSADVVISSRMVVPRHNGQNAVQHVSTQSKSRRISMVHRTQRSGVLLVSGIDHDIETRCPHHYKTENDADHGQVDFIVSAQAGRAIHVTKYITYHTSMTASPKEMELRAEWTLDRITYQGFRELLEEQEQYLQDFWTRSEVHLKGTRAEMARRTTVEMQQAIRLKQFHIIQASARAEDCGVAVKGLTADTDGGHCFGHAEIYLFPFLVYTSPHLAKNLLRVRYNMLGKARARAGEMGLQGAVFPWRTINGQEASASYELGAGQHHINADVAYALRKYINATADEEFLLHFGAEILIETARFWYSLGFFSNRKEGKFCINGVSGPDEYNIAVNNNAYTNLMARENLRYAIETMELISLKNRETLNALIDKTGFELSELEDWRRAADRMYIPFESETGIYPQDDSFLDRKPWDRQNGAVQHPLAMYRHRIVKQPEVILAMFLLSSEFSSEAKKRNFSFYESLLTGDSSLSSCIEAIVALELGEYDKAVRYGHAALLMDFAGEFKDGCDTASMGAAWMVFAYGYAGLRDQGGKLSFRPQRPPEPQMVLRFPLTWQGRVLEIEIGPDSVSYYLRSGDELSFRHDDEAITLTALSPRATRRVVRAGMIPVGGDGNAR